MKNNHKKKRVKKFTWGIYNQSPTTLQVISNKRSPTTIIQNNPSQELETRCVCLSDMQFVAVQVGVFE
jgi:hypothetical protein